MPIGPSDERPPAMYGHFCLVPRVSVHDRYYCTQILLIVTVVAQCEKEEEKLVTENANLRKEVNQLNERLTQAEIRNGSRFRCLASMLHCRGGEML